MFLCTCMPLFLRERNVNYAYFQQLKYTEGRTKPHEARCVPADMWWDAWLRNTKVFCHCPSTPFNEVSYMICSRQTLGLRIHPQALTFGLCHFNPSESGKGKSIQGQTLFNSTNTLNSSWQFVTTWLLSICVREKAWLDSELQWCEPQAMH